MAIYTLKNATVYQGSLNVSDHTKRVELAADINSRDATALGGGGWQVNVPGLVAVDFHGEANFDTTAQNEPTNYGNIARTNIPLSIYGEGAALGKVGYAFQAMQSRFRPALKIGDLAVYSIDASSSGSALVRVTSMSDVTARTNNSNSQGIQLGAVPAGKSLHSFIHVLSASGTNPTLSVGVWSSSTQNGTYTGKIAHSTFTAPNSEYRNVSGPITDTWYNVHWVVTGTNPSFTFQIGVGIV
jgi:hypothetical protein